jgi:hypothetical protein
MAEIIQLPPPDIRRLIEAENREAYIPPQDVAEVLEILCSIIGKKVAI